MKKKLPVSVLFGDLGAGKIKLLNHFLLNNEEFEDNWALERSFPLDKIIIFKKN